MHTSILLSLAAALSTLTAGQQLSHPSHFMVSNFVISGDNWRFKVTIQGTNGNANVPNPIPCEGNFPADDYYYCDAIDDNHSISAYIDSSNKLKLTYDAFVAQLGELQWFRSETTDLSRTNFNMYETSSSAAS